MVFLGALYAGLALGGIYDIFRLLKLAFKQRFIQLLLDLLFCLCAMAISSCVLYILASFEIRLYTLLGIVLGFAIYLAGISSIIKWIVNKTSKKKPKKTYTYHQGKNV